MDGAIIHSHAISIEHDLTNEYKCERFGIGGIANSDHIQRSGFYHCMAMVLIKYYNGDNKAIIDSFLNDIWDIDGINMEDLGLKKVEEVLERYEKVYKKVKGK